MWRRLLPISTSFGVVVATLVLLLIDQDKLKSWDALNLILLGATILVGIFLVLLLVIYFLAPLSIDSNLNLSEKNRDGPVRESESNTHSVASHESSFHDEFPDIIPVFKTPGEMVSRLFYLAFLIAMVFYSGFLLKIVGSPFAALLAGISAVLLNPEIKINSRASQLLLASLLFMGSVIIFVSWILL